MPKQKGMNGIVSIAKHAQNFSQYEHLQKINEEFKMFHFKKTPRKWIRKSEYHQVVEAKREGNE